MLILENHLFFVHARGNSKQIMTSQFYVILNNHYKVHGYLYTFFNVFNIMKTEKKD